MRKMIYERGPALYLLTIATIIAIYFGRMCAPAHNYVLKGEITQEQALELRSDILITEAERSLLQELAEMNEIAARIEIPFSANETNSQSRFLDHLYEAPYEDLVCSMLEIDRFQLFIEKTATTSTLSLIYSWYSDASLSVTWIDYTFDPATNHLTKELDITYFVKDETHGDTEPNGFLYLTNENNTRFTMDTARKV